MKSRAVFLINKIIQLYNLYAIKVRLNGITDILNRKISISELLKKLNKVQKIKPQAEKITKSRIYRCLNSKKFSKINRIRRIVWVNRLWWKATLWSSSFYFKDISNTKYNGEKIHVIKFLVLDSAIDTFR